MLNRCAPVVVVLGVVPVVVSDVVELPEAPTVPLLPVPIAAELPEEPAPVAPSPLPGRLPGQTRRLGHRYVYYVTHQFIIKDLL